VCFPMAVVRHNNFKSFASFLSENDKINEGTLKRYLSNNAKNLGKNMRNMAVSTVHSAAKGLASFASRMENSGYY